MRKHYVEPKLRNKLKRSSEMISDLKKRLNNKTTENYNEFLYLQYISNEQDIRKFSSFGYWAVGILCLILINIVVFLN